MYHLNSLSTLLRNVIVNKYLFTFTLSPTPSSVLRAVPRERDNSEPYPNPWALLAKTMRIHFSARRASHVSDLTCLSTCYLPQSPSPNANLCT